MVSPIVPPPPYRPNSPGSYGRYGVIRPGKAGLDWYDHLAIYALYAGILGGSWIVVKLIDWLTGG